MNRPHTPHALRKRISIYRIICSTGPTIVIADQKSTSFLGKNLWTAPVALNKNYFLVCANLFLQWDIRPFTLTGGLFPSWDTKNRIYRTSKLSYADLRGCVKTKSFGANGYVCIPINHTYVRNKEDEQRLTNYLLKIEWHSTVCWVKLQIGVERYSQVVLPYNIAFQSTI